MSQRKSGVLLGYLTILTKNFVNFLYVPMLLHFIGQQDYGLFQMTNSITFTFTLISGGFAGSYVRFYMKEEVAQNKPGIKKLNSIYLIVYSIVALISLILGVLLSLKASILFENGLTHRELILAKKLLLIMTGTIALQLLSTPFEAYIIAKEQFIYNQTRQIATSICTPALALLLLYFGFGAIGVAFSIQVITLLLLVLNISYAIKKLGMSFTTKELKLNYFYQIAVFSFWIFLNQIFDLVNNNVPNLLLGAMSGASAVATFSIAIQVRNIFFSLSTVTASVFTPQVNRIVATTNNDNTLTHLMTKVGKYQMILFWFIFGGFITVGQFFIEVWAGKQNSDVYWLTLIMVVPLFIPLTQNLGIEIQRAKNRHKTRSIIYIFTSGIDIIISLMLIPAIGYWATAVGYIVSILLGPGLFMNWYYQTHIGLNIKYFWKEMLNIILVSVIVITICAFGKNILPITSMITFIAWGVLYSCIYILVTLYVFLDSTTRRRIYNRIGKILRHR